MDEPFHPLARTWLTLWRRTEPNQKETPDMPWVYVPDSAEVAAEKLAQLRGIVADVTTRAPIIQKSAETEIRKVLESIENPLKPDLTKAAPARDRAPRDRAPELPTPDSAELARAMMRHKSDLVSAERMAELREEAGQQVEPAERPPMPMKPFLATVSSAAEMTKFAASRGLGSVAADTTKAHPDFLAGNGIVGGPGSPTGEAVIGSPGFAKAPDGLRGPEKFESPMFAKQAKLATQKAKATRLLTNQELTPALMEVAFAGMLTTGEIDEVPVIQELIKAPFFSTAFKERATQAVTEIQTRPVNEEGQPPTKWDSF